MNKISQQKLNKYLNITQKAFDKIKLAPPEKTELHNAAKRVLDMATRYFEDAQHFKQKKDYVNAFACVNYAHGWLDAGASLGLFDVGGDSKLFTVD